MENVVVAEHVIGQPGRARGERDDGVKPVRGERPVQRLPRPPGRLRAGRLVTGFREIAGGCLGLLEVFLAEMGQDGAGVLKIEFDEARQVRGPRSAQAGQVGVEVVLELVDQGRELRFGDLARAG